MALSASGCRKEQTKDNHLLFGLVPVGGSVGLQLCRTGGNGGVKGCWAEGGVALVLMSCGDGRAAVHGPALLCRVVPQ